jgi:hypothetical protein
MIGRRNVNFFKKGLVIALAWTFLSFSAAMARDLPDPAMTPGWTDPRVTKETIKQTICVSGYTETVRPPTSYTNKLKQEQIKAYGYSDTKLGHYEEDHLISLQLGGSPDDPRNLWPQPYEGSCGARVKDKIEGKLKRLVCSGKITLEEAQQAIATDWIEAYKKYYDPAGCK